MSQNKQQCCVERTHTVFFLKIAPFSEHTERENRDLRIWAKREIPLRENNSTQVSNSFSPADGYFLKQERSVSDLMAQSKKWR